MRLRRSACGFLALCLTLAYFMILPAGARPESLGTEAPDQGAAESVPLTASSPKGGDKAAVSLEQAIKIAKGAFVVPDGFDQFSTGFDQSEKMSFWELRWYRSGEPGGDMNVRVNAQTGEIWSMHRWVPPLPGQGYRGLPKYTREQAEAIAAAQAGKLQPQRFKETMPQPGQDYLPPLLHQERGQVEYRYNYTRVVGGIPYLENGINITVSGDTGEVLGFDLRWDDTSGLPPASNRLPQARAEQIFRAESSPQLFYFRPRVPGGKEVPIKLVYRLPGPQDQVLIDAITGKVLNKEGKFFYYDEGFFGGGGDAMMSGAGKNEIALTPVEEGAVEDAKNLLSREKALEAAVTFLKVPGEYNLKSSRLEQDYLFKDQKSWHFNWQSGDGEGRKWMEAFVDASTGELVSFYSDRYRGRYDYQKPPEVKYSQEKARKTAEDFIKRAQPGKWEQVVFKSSRPEPGPIIQESGQPLPRSYSFYWSRVANGVEFPENGFSLEVDSATGEVFRYHLTWWDVDFPAPRGVIGQESAATKYLREAPLTAAYMRLHPGDKWEMGSEPKVYLVYHLARKKFAMLDALTGETLDFQGNVVSNSEGKVVFRDMKDHPAREAVELLARLGIVSGTEGRFRPDDPVTQAELITMLVKSSGYQEYLPKPAARPGEPWYRPYYDAAVRKGIIQAGEKPEPDAPVNRETLASLTVHAMGLYKAARFSDLYVLNFKDAAEISRHLRGHAALAGALGLIQPVEGRFNPGTIVTRADAATTIVRLLNNL